MSPVLLRVRREPFEHGLIPVRKLIFTDGTSTLASIKAKLLQSSFVYSLDEDKKFPERVNTANIAECLDLPQEEARLVLESLASVLPEPDPLAHASEENLEVVGGNVYDLVIFLYIQTYKRLLPRPHKDATTLADVWPSTSAFDGCLSALTPLQLVRSGRRFMPSQADEEMHQLSYIQKHLLNILCLLADVTDEEQIESQVLNIERFEHINFLLSVGEGVPENTPFSQVAPFFANSDPDMPAVPVSVSQAYDWVFEHTSPPSESPSEKAYSRINGPSNTGDPDITMVEASTGPQKVHHQQAIVNGPQQRQKPLHPRGITFIEGISKVSLLKQREDIEDPSIKVLNCHDAVIYILAPLKYATIYGCSDAIVVLGAVGKAVRVEHCERMQVITATRRICISNCRDCLLYLGVNQRPLVVGDNHKLQVAPYNTFYSNLESHLSEVGIDPAVNLWDMPLALGIVDPHDSISHAAGVSDGKTESATLLPPENFTTFVVPKWFQSESSGETKGNPFALPHGYLAAQQQRSQSFEEIRKLLRNIQLEDNKRRELVNAIHLHFRDWLQASGSIRQLYCLQSDE